MSSWSVAGCDRAEAQWRAKPSAHAHFAAVSPGAPPRPLGGWAARGPPPPSRWRRFSGVLLHEDSHSSAQLPRISAGSSFSEIPERFPIFANPRGTQERGQLDAPGLLYPREFSGLRLLRRPRS
jgi:hypothetical protein